MIAEHNEQFSLPSMLRNGTMRRLAVFLIFMLTACGAPPNTPVTPYTARTYDAPGDTSPETMAAIRRAMAENAARENGIPTTPEDPADLNRRTARTAQQRELLERALTNSPDYAQAVRRAAIANVDTDTPLPPPGRRSRPDFAEAREQRIAAEEARLSDLIEKHRRARLAGLAMQDQAARLSAARGACDAQASAVGAGVQTPYSPRAGILGSALVGAINSSAAEEQARAGCYRAQGL